MNAHLPLLLLNAGVAFVTAASAPVWVARPWRDLVIASQIVFVIVGVACTVAIVVEVAP